jgi:hypothetical protein
MGAVGSNLRCSIEGAPSGLIYGGPMFARYRFELRWAKAGRG